MKVELEITDKEVHGIKVVHVKTNNLMSYVAFHCLSGSYHESEEDQGVSHYLEHMFFKGTEKRGYAAISDDAAIIGATQNAFTSEIDTCYHLTAPSENVDQCIELLSDMMFHSTFPVEEIDKEKTVIQAERKSYEDSPANNYWNVMEKMLFNYKVGHSVIGTEETINNVSQESLIAFKERYYGSNNTILLVISSVKAEDVFEYCETHLKDNGLKKVEVTPLEEDLIPEPKDIKFTSPSIQQSYLSMLYKSLEMDNDNATLENCLNLYLGGGLYGILGKVIREELGLCYHIGVYNLYSTTHDGTSCVYTQLDEDNVPLAKDRIIESLQSIADGEVDEDLFKCAKAQMLAGWCSSMDSPSKLSRNIAKKLLFDYEVDATKDYHRLLALTFEDFKKYSQKRTKEMIDSHSWAEMSPEPVEKASE